MSESQAKETKESQSENQKSSAPSDSKNKESGSNGGSSGGGGKNTPLMTALKSMCCAWLLGGMGCFINAWATGLFLFFLFVTYVFRIIYWSLTMPLPGRYYRVEFIIDLIGGILYALSAFISLAVCRGNFTCTLIASDMFNAILASATFFVFAVIEFKQH